MTDIQIYAGQLLATKDPRVFSARLVPFGEECSSNLGRFSVDPGVFSIPADPTGVSFNVEHKREAVAGALFATREEADGIWTDVRFAKTPQGDKALEDVKSGKRRGISVEAADVMIRAGKAISGRIFGGALVREGAWPSATLMAAAADTVDEQPELPIDEAPAKAADAPAAEVPAEPVTTEEHKEDEVTAEDGTTVRRTEDVVTETETAEDGTVTTTTTTTVVEESTPAETPADTEEDAVSVPNTLTAGKAPAVTKPRPTDLRTLFAALNRAKVRQATKEDMTLLAAASLPLAGAPEDINATLMAALSDITISGANSLPVGGAAIQPNWVGQLNQGITYERQYVPLAKLGTEITAEGKKGYKVRRGTAAAPVDSYAETGKWAGNKAAIGSGTGFTEPFNSELHRFAFGDDVAREYYDLPGGEAVLATFFSLIKEDHLVWSDELARLAWIELAGVPNAEATYPTEYPGALGTVMQAIRAVNKEKADKRRDKASFVIVNDEAAEEIDYTPFEMIPEFIKFSWNLDRSDLKAGDVVLVNGDNGITGSPASLAGASYALELDELAGGPLWIDALNIANGGVDRAIHGYLQEFQVRPEAVELVGTPETFAQSTAYPLGRLVVLSSVVYRVVVAGTTAASNPSAPAVGSTVVSGTATLLRLA